MADLRKLGKGVTGALAQAKQLAAAEREANLQRMLEPSKVKERLYHGTTATEGGKGQEAIRRLKPSKEGALGSGVYLTPNTAHASGYTGIPNDEAIESMLVNPTYQSTGMKALNQRNSGNLLPEQEGGNMLPVYAQLRNPLVIEGTHADPMIEALTKLGMDEASASKMVERAYEQKGYIGKQVESRARAAGYDGLMQYRDGDLSEVVVYNPNAIKSATGNQGTYDIYNPDLSKADGGRIAKGVMGALAKAKDMAKTEKTVQLGDRALPVTMHPVEVREGNVLADINPQEFDRAFKKSSWQYVGPQGEGGIGDRYKRFGEFAQTAPSMNASNVAIGKNGIPVFGDGRHRYAYLRDQGVDSIPMSMDKESLENARLNKLLSETNKAKGGVIHMADAGRVTRGFTGALAKATEAARAEKLALAKLDAGERLSKAENIAAGLYHPIGEGKKLNVPFSRMTSTVVDNPNVIMHQGKIITPEQAVKERMGFFPLIGDRAETGKILTHVNERKAKYNTPLTGGGKYMQANYDPVMSQSAGWESGKGKVGTLKNRITDIVESNYQPVGVFSPGSHVQVDFNTMMPHALLGQFDSTDTSKKLIKQFDKEVKSVYPDWVGITNPEAEAQLMDKSNGVLRTAFTKTMGKDDYQSGGFPDVPSVRKAISDPSLHDTELGTLGQNMALFDPTGALVQTPKHPSSYPLSMSAQNLGKMDQPEKFSDFFTTANERRRLLGADPASDYRSFELSQPIQYADEEWLNKLMESRRLRDELIKRGEYAKGGDVNATKKESNAVERKETPEEMARFHKRFALHKATGGKLNIPQLSLRKSKRMADGGSSSEPTAKEIAAKLGQLAVEQGKEEFESYKKPRAATDIGNRGILAPALGAPVDLMNMGLMAADYIGSKATGKPIRLSSEKPFGGSEHLKDLMDKYGVTSGEDRPLTETALSLFSPTGMVKGAIGMTKGAVKASDAMRKPVSGLGAMRAKTN